MSRRTRGVAVNGLQRAARRVLAGELNALNDRLWMLERDRDLDRSQADLGIGVYDSLQEARRTKAYLNAFEEREPLVSVVVATFNRAPLLIERSVASLLRQTYKNIEILVVGDACTDASEARLRALDDSRISWTNLPVRGPYPEDNHRRWMVAGSGAMNAGLRMSRGAFVTHLDDDDEHHPARIERLVAQAQASRAEVLWHPFRYQDRGYAWRVNDALEFNVGKVSTSSVFYHSWFARIEWDVQSHTRLEPGDWARFRKFVWLGARMERHPEVLLEHYRERSNT